MDSFILLMKVGFLTVHNPTKVAAIKGSKQVGSVTSGKREVTVAITRYINTLDNSVPLLLIFPNVYFKIHMLTSRSLGTHGTSRSSGWSNEDKFLEFLGHFIYHVKQTKDHQVLILLDNHESHITVPAITKCQENAVMMLTFPPHTNHKQQPLHRCVFGPCKKFHNVASRNFMLGNPGKLISIYNFAH